MIGALLFFIFQVNKQNETIFNQLHVISAYPAVSGTQQTRQRELSVKTLCFPLSTKFWRHSGLSAATQPGMPPELGDNRTQRHTLPQHQSKEMKK